MFFDKSPIPCDGVWSSGRYQPHPGLWSRVLQTFYNVLAFAFGLGTQPYTMVSRSQSYFPLEVLPDYYLNYDSAKRLWQDWRVLRRLFTRRDHSRDLLFQGESGWLPIHGMTVNRQSLIVTTDEGETVLDLNESVVWLSRANPANTKITREPVSVGSLDNHLWWCPA